MIPMKSIMNHPLKAYRLAILEIDLTVSYVSGSLYSVKKFIIISARKQTSTQYPIISNSSELETLKHT